ncbi:MAG: bifunctional phosphoserine phosphatase/homoserine phosphotransferase ThrH [Caldilineaceae bacterium]|nr:bifunctional phosphoserine phosphatase/homoserine phosphotransferase ThrH [Caldilineaceae bacterium]HRJ42617.1 bifunctional phosphoserine phosphatase/homoserine phosphotransferase ThrH [Caldilineaceae bacterium]
MTNPKPTIVASDLEGVLVPEIWIAVAEETGIEQLRLTTREISDYDQLMKMRIGILRQHNLGLPDIQRVIAGLRPLPGAAEFVAWVRERSQFVIISDTFYEFAAPLMAQMGFPTIFCHSLITDSRGMITGYQMRLDHPKRRSVRALQEIGFQVFAMGDSYNDIAMLEVADHAMLFAPPDNVVADYPHFAIARSHDEIRRFLEEVLFPGALVAA